MAVKPIPDGYHTVTPFIIATGAGELIDFIVNAFGAVERMRMPGPDGTVAHAEVAIGDSVIMLSDGSAEFPPAPVTFMVYVEDVDTAFARAVAAGGIVTQEPQDQFYGDRTGMLKDRWGNSWSLATHVEDVSEEEMMKRMAALGGPGAS